MSARAELPFHTFVNIIISIVFVGHTIKRYNDTMIYPMHQQHISILAINTINSSYIIIVSIFIGTYIGHGY